LLCVCALAQAQQLAPIPALDSPVIDTTGTLDAATKQALEAQAFGQADEQRPQRAVIQRKWGECHGLEKWLYSHILFFAGAARHLMVDRYP